MMPPNNQSVAQVSVKLGIECSLYRNLGQYLAEFIQILFGLQAFGCFTSKRFQFLFVQLLIRERKSI